MSFTAFTPKPNLINNKFDELKSGKLSVRNTSMLYASPGCKTSILHGYQSESARKSLRATLVSPSSRGLLLAVNRHGKRKVPL